MYRQWGKRLFDVVLAVIGLVLCLVPGGVIALLVWARTGRPVVFAQNRVGRYGQPFKVYKFRTMRVEADGPDQSTITTRDDPRITPLGRKLRRWKLDELPQLWNVLRGDMSFVGPRPDVASYAERLTGVERRILDIRPGVTGLGTLKYHNEEELLASVPDPQRYNDEVIFPDKVRLNLLYVEHMSLFWDCRIIAATVYWKLPFHWLRALLREAPPGARGPVAELLTATPLKGTAEPAVPHQREAILLIGAGGHARVVLDAAQQAGFPVCCILDDYPQDADLLGVPVRARAEGLATLAPGQAFLVAVGDNRDRERLFVEMMSLGFKPVTVVHPKACVSPLARLERGVFLAAMAVVNPDAVIGDNSIVNTAASVDHGCQVGAHVHLCPGVRLSGRVSVGERSFLGTGCSVLPNLRIGKDVVVGAGAVVTWDLPDHCVAVGVPARVVKLNQKPGQREPSWGVADGK